MKYSVSFVSQEMEGNTIQDLIDNLLQAKEKYGNIPVVVGVSYSGNYWMEPVKRLTLTTINESNMANADVVDVLLLEE
ncbi:hypothetical protein [Brazilian marseillevirus]|uniref:hypothetical protein n=1 Tax=Brazilian marseillevirus TaxID=1813599 RepID=UPI0007864F4E|nr:hypothetical protein A3303_gp468 [Brazilian marseillevirus]AMQ10976.1 hypothetical protein [Brazilian marseillevirus]